MVTRQLRGQLRFTVPYLPPASYSPNSRVKWTAKRGKKGDNHRVLEDVRVLVLEAGWDQKIIPVANIEVTFHFPSRIRRDHENFIARCKPIFDALVRLGVLPDDHIDLIGWPRYGHIYTSPPATIIDINPAAPIYQGGKRGKK